MALGYRESAAAMNYLPVAREESIVDVAFRFRSHALLHQSAAVPDRLGRDRTAAPGEAVARMTLDLRILRV